MKYDVKLIHFSIHDKTDPGFIQYKMAEVAAYLNDGYTIEDHTAVGLPPVTVVHAILLIKELNEQ